MGISGITLGYRALANGYPVRECVRCLLSFCDEVVANIGNSDDGTAEALREIAGGKLRLLEDPWDMSVREKGLAISRETNRAMERCGGDWIVYLQADELMHEDDIPLLCGLLRELQDREEIDGISFRYLHFYGDYRHIQDNPLRWYTRAVRAVRAGRGIASVGDGLKFRRFVDGHPRRLQEKRSHCRVFHYGWAKPAVLMLEKQRHLDRFWHDDAAIAKRYAGIAADRLLSDTAHLVRFAGTHPAEMRERVAAADWDFSPPTALRPRWLRLGLALLMHPFHKVMKVIW